MEDERIWQDGFSDREDIEGQFQETGGLAGAVVLAATYEYQDYEGSAFVLFERDGKLYEVNGSHCSCDGLEGQWAPEETSWGAVAMRVRSGERYPHIGGQVLTELVDRHVPMPPQGDSEGGGE